MFYKCCIRHTASVLSSCQWITKAILQSGDFFFPFFPRILGPASELTSCICFLLYCHSLTAWFQPSLCLLMLVWLISFKHYANRHSLYGKKLCLSWQNWHWIMWKLKLMWSSWALLKGEGLSNPGRRNGCS